MDILKMGDQAPAFEANNQKGEMLSLANFKGKTLILFFYPKDDTPGCTKEACNLRDNYAKLMQDGFAILGVSPDGEDSHQKFIEKYQLPFPLLVDTDKTILTAYEAWGEKNMYGKMVVGVKRKTYIISPEGKILKIFKRVKTAEHTEQILAAMEKIKA